MSDTSRRTQTALNQAVHYRNYRRVRDRALRRLANQYPDQYKQYLEEERAKDETEGKAWLDISGRTRNGVPTGGHTPLESTEDRPKQAVNNHRKEGNVGGKA